MSRATISVLGLYTSAPNLFDKLVIPQALDRETLVDNLLAELAEFEVLYPSAPFMRLMIGTWSKKQLPIWEKLYKTTILEYDPISNYDRKEEWTDDANKSGDSSSSFRGSTTASGTSTEENKVSAFNEAGYTPHDSSQRGETQNQDNQSDTNAYSTEQSTNRRTGRAYGNIGVTTTQQMIEQERESVLYNIYDTIIADFKRRFCLAVY
ncbi:MAG: hypothetical protein KBT02_10240 [Treponema sp.]|nr:hypothetical protein [Candidatus Treponema caballi]